MIKLFSSCKPLILLTPSFLFCLCASAQEMLPLDNSTCNPQTTVNCLWNDHAGCFIRASSTVDNSSCAPLDASGRAGVQVTSPDGTQITTTRCRPSVTVNALCDTIIGPVVNGSVSPFEVVTINLNPTPTPTPTPPPPPQCDGTGDGAGFTQGSGGNVTNCSPIIIDTTGDGFSLTSALGGVTFDIGADGHPIQIAWTAPGSHNAFLALDRNHNGKVDDGSELFGNFTVQPKSSTPNGFLALAEFDKPENGGNADGVIDEQDAVFPYLVLWIDSNHDGISQLNELHPLNEFGIYSLSFDYKESRRQDGFGNVFRFRAKVNPSDKDDQTDTGRWAYDVFLVTK